MNANELRALQAPLKSKYRENPSTALVKMRSVGHLHVDQLVCRVETARGPVSAGLHSAAGGDGTGACSGDMLLDALVACAGVTLAAVATATGIPLRGGTVTAEGDLDFRGTLGVSKEVPVGIPAVRLEFALDTDATDEQLDQLIKMTERYCVIFQTLSRPPKWESLVRRR
jgi:uncharacterized OsmC-like protein